MKAEDRSEFDPEARPSAKSPDWFVLRLWCVHLAGFAVVFHMLVDVSPRYEWVFKESDTLLPWITQAVIRYSNRFASYWFLFLFGWLVGIVALRTIARCGYRGTARFLSWMALAATILFYAFAELGLRIPGMAAELEAKKAREAQTSPDVRSR